MTNSSNSDGRWPPPPAQTCEFNREWVLDEIQATRDALEACKKAVAGIDLLPEDEPERIADWDYSFDFTAKDPQIVEKLNLYELQHAIYYAHKMVDCPDEQRKKEGRDLLIRIFDEFDRRGMKGIRPDAARR